jgi:hypothetical protein
MNFLMLVCRDEAIGFGPEQRARIGPEIEAWVSEMQSRGIRLQGEVLAPVDATRTVSVRDGDVIVERGPRVQMDAPASGFNLLDCADVDEAVEVAAAHPIARFGVIELRPFA